jgi:hypothetical protein
MVTQCQDNDPDAFKSFFSGHSSGSMALGLYYSFYVSYTIYYRSFNPIIIRCVLVCVGVSPRSLRCL